MNFSLAIKELSMCNYYVGADRVQLSWHFVVELVKYRFPDQLTAYLLS